MANAADEEQHTSDGGAVHVVMRERDRECQGVIIGRLELVCWLMLCFDSFMLLFLSSKKALADAAGC